MSIESLTDSRYKFYALTTKGIVFLHILKESLTQALIHMDTGSVSKTMQDLLYWREKHENQNNFYFFYDYGIVYW